MKYVPILKWKQGEQFALMNLSEDVKSKLTPLISLVNLSTSPDELTAQINRFWGNNEPFYLGFSPNLYSKFSSLIAPYFAKIIKHAISLDLKIIPVISNLNDNAFYRIIAAQKHNFSHGYLLRLLNVDTESINQVTNYIMNSCNISDSKPSILLDFYMVDAKISPISYSDIICSLYKKLRIDQFDKIIFAASSFPVTLSGLENNSITRLSRHEWLIYKNIRSKIKDIAFGDYCVDDPLDLNLSQGATIIPTIRYTKDDYWYIIRGKHDPTRPRDFSQYHKLCRALIKRKDIYCGEEFSWGDEKINECANKTCSGSKGCNHGNLPEWVKRNTNHHLTYVANQYYNYISSSKST